MRKIIFITILVLTCIDADAQEMPIILNSKITDVTVFSSGAEVQRQAETIDLPQGTFTVMFQGLSSSIAPQSIQVKGEGNFTVLSVTQQQNFLTQKENSVQVNTYRNKVADLNARIVALNAENEVYKQEVEMLIKNQTVMGPTLNYDLLKLKQALDFQKQRLLEAKNKQIEINKEIVKLQAELTKYNQQIYELEGKSSISSNDIVMKVVAKAATKGRFTLTYLVNSASWYPSYDIRAKNISSPIELIYKANVAQSSGEDWKNVKLFLSSGNPTVNNTKPELLPYNLAFKNFVSAEYNISLSETVVTGYAVKGKVAGLNVRGMNSLTSTPVEVSTVEMQTSVVFDIKDPYTIMSDGKRFSVDIGVHELKADYTYYAAPKLRDDVFLTARVTGFNALNLMNGEANVFFDGTYLGKTGLNVQNATDTLSISLGIDKNVVIKREKQTDFNERQFLASFQKDSRSFVIDIKNRKGQAINLMVEDQLPISTSNDITVEKQEISKAKLDETTGILTWLIQLQPNEQKKLSLKYQVKYPKNKPINLE